MLYLQYCLVVLPHLVYGVREDHRNAYVDLRIVLFSVSSSSSSSSIVLSSWWRRRRLGFHFDLFLTFHYFFITFFVPIADAIVPVVVEHNPRPPAAPAAAAA